MASKEHYDLVVLGSGSTAVAAAKESMKNGKTVLLTEEKLLGGTCLNTGCVPSKFLIEAAKEYHHLTNPLFDGITCGAPKLDFKKVLEQKDSIVDGYRSKKAENLLDGSKLTLRRGHARFESRSSINVDGKSITGEYFLIATGARAFIPEIPGLDEVDYLTSELLSSKGEDQLKELPESLTVVGGGYIALELGQMFSRFGTKVTVLEKSKQILSDGYEPEVGDCIADVLSSEGISIKTSTEILSVEERDGGVSIRIKTNGKEETITSQKLLVAAGRIGNTDNLGLDEIGIERVENGFIKVDQYLQTNLPHVFAAGDVIGSQIGNEMATPVGVRDAEYVARNAFLPRVNLTTRHDVVPRTIFTDPEVAVIGLTAARAEKIGKEIVEHSIPLSHIPRAKLMQREDGFIKVIAEKESGTILGATVIAPLASEMINEIAVAMRFHAKAQDLSELIHVYPSVSQGFKLATA